MTHAKGEDGTTSGVGNSTVLEGQVKGMDVGVTGLGSVLEGGDKRAKGGGVVAGEGPRVRVEQGVW